jgi:hypothetical protein
VFEADGQKIAHLFQGRPHAFQFSEVHEVRRQNAIAERRQLLCEAIRFGGIRDFLESLHQESSAEK